MTMMKDELRMMKKESVVAKFTLLLSRASSATTIFVLFFILHASSFILPAYGGSGASFLKVPVGARAAGMGNAYTAVVNDVTALHWNPAGLSQLSQREVGAMHAQMFSAASHGGDSVGARYDFIGYAHPVTGMKLREKRDETAGNFSYFSHSAQPRSSNLVFGVGAVYLNQGEIEGRTEGREKSPEFSASDLAITIGAGRFVTKQSSLGMNIKLLQSRISGYSSTGFAFDLGILKSPSKLGNYNLPLTFGFAIQNIGPEMKFLEEQYSLPLTVAGGTSVKLFSAFLISSDLRYQPYDSKTSFSLGTEFSPSSMISLRAGYGTKSDTGYSMPDNNKKSLSGIRNPASGIWALGIGFKIGSSNIDYSFTPAGESGNSQRFSLSFKF